MTLKIGGFIFEACNVDMALLPAMLNGPGILRLRVSCRLVEDSGCAV
jgi:hypothetical protein